MTSHIAMKTRTLGTPIPVPVALTALWAAVLVCSLIGNSQGLYAPALGTSILAGDNSSIITQLLHVGYGITMALPSLMIASSALLPARAARAANIVLGAAYIVVVAISMGGSWPTDLTIGSIEIGLAGLAIWIASTSMRGHRTVGPAKGSAQPQRAAATTSLEVIH